MTPADPALTSESDLRVDPSAPFAKCSPWNPWKSTVTTGDRRTTGPEAPSIVTVSVIAGRDAPRTTGSSRRPEVDRVGARPLIGIDDRLPQRAGPDVVEVRHGEGGQELTVLEQFEGRLPSVSPEPESEAGSLPH